MSGGTTPDVLRQLTELPEDGEKKIQRSITFIHALAKHLLNISEGDGALFVGVLPLRERWYVRVNYNDFLLQKEADDLPTALELMLQHLAKTVSQRLEDGSKLLNKIET